MHFEDPDSVAGGHLGREVLRLSTNEGPGCFVRKAHDYPKYQTNESEA